VCCWKPARKRVGSSGEARDAGTGIAQERLLLPRTKSIKVL